MWTTHQCRFTKVIQTTGSGSLCPVLESRCHVAVREVSSQMDGELSNDVNYKEMFMQISEMTLGWPSSGAMKLLEDLVMTMKVEEISQFDLSSSLQLSPSDSSDKNELRGPEIKLMIVIELVGFEDIYPLWQLENGEKYDLALVHKNEGSKLFQGGDVQLAFFHYSLSVKYLISIIRINNEESEEEENNHTELKCISYVNLAACHLKCKNYESVVKTCSKALAIDSHHVKALYRRASAYKELGQKDNARSDLICARKHEPQNRAVYNLLMSLKESS